MPRRSPMRSSPARSPARWSKELPAWRQSAQLPQLAPKPYLKARDTRSRTTNKRCGVAPCSVALAGYVEQLLPSANPRRGRNRPRRRPGSHVETVPTAISAAAGRSTISACLTPRAAILPKSLSAWPRKSMRGCPSSFSSRAAPVSSKTSCLSSSRKISGAERLSRQVWLLADWLAAKAPDFGAGRLVGAHILLHGHCHHKAVFGGPANEIAVLRKAGATVEAIQAGCCGMAGPFGFEADKFEVSKAIANDGLLPAVRAADSMTISLPMASVAASRSATRQQAGHALRRSHGARSCGCGG